MSKSGGGGHYAAQQRKRINGATKSFGVIVQVIPEVFLEIIEKQEQPLVLVSTGRMLYTLHHRYLTSYKGLTFFTKCYNEINLPEKSEIINAYQIKVPDEDFAVY